MQQRTITGLFQNVNDDRGLPEHLPKYALAERIGDILVGDYDFYALSEISAKNHAMVRDRLVAMGYSHVSMAYSPNQTPDMSFYHILAWKRLSVVSVKPHWFTNAETEELTPETRGKDPILAAYNEPWEKGTLVGVFEANDATVIISVNHFGLKRFGNVPQYTNGCARMLANILARYEMTYPGATVVAGADFNAFSDSNHVDEFLSLMHTSGYVDATPPEQSFCSYPWDLGLMRPETKDRIVAAKEEMKLLTGQAYIDRAVVCLRDLYGGPLCSRIDRVLSNNRDASVKATMDMSTITLDDYSESPFAPSDHAGYIVEIAV